APEQRQKLAWVLLVELLSYQFASPVHWIETQDLFFRQYALHRDWPIPNSHWYGCTHPQGQIQGDR
ncbi:hypothetical protein BGW80DRAFT_1410098, partial [Lactifluus volemus]